MLSNKVKSLPEICGVYFSSELAQPQSISDLFQSFYDSNYVSEDLTKIYTTASKVSYKEESQESSSGYSFQQTIIISMPIADYKRSKRISEIMKARDIVLALTNNTFIHIGRNDHQQNAKPKIKYTANHHLAQFKIVNQSVFATGYANINSIPGFPYLLPSNS